MTNANWIEPEAKPITNEIKDWCANLHLIREFMKWNLVWMNNED